MDNEAWLDEVSRRMRTQLADVEVSRPDGATVSISRGLRTVVFHATGTRVLLAPSFAAGGTFGSRLQARVQHLGIEHYGVSEATIDVAVGAAMAHLHG